MKVQRNKGCDLMRRMKMNKRMSVLVVMIVGMALLTACGKWEVETGQRNAEILKEAEAAKKTDIAEDIEKAGERIDIDKANQISETEEKKNTKKSSETSEEEQIVNEKEIWQKATAETVAFWEEPEWEDLYAQAIKKYEKEHERDVRYELVYVEGERIPKLYFHCLDDTYKITEIYGLKNNVNAASKETEESEEENAGITEFTKESVKVEALREDTSYKEMQLVPEGNRISAIEEQSHFEIKIDMEYDEILQYLEIRSIAKKEKRQIWEVKGLELLWRVLNRKEFLPSSISADLYCDGNGTQFLVKDLSGDGIPEIMISTYLVGDCMGGSGVYCFDGSDYVRGTDYTLETYDEETGRCGMLYGVSAIEDYAIGCFRGNEFVTELEFGAYYESNRYRKVENGTEKEINVQEFRTLKDYHINYGTHGLSGEVLNIQNVEKVYGIQLTYRQYDRILKSYYDVICGKRELNTGIRFEEYNLDYYFKAILDNAHEFTLLDCDEDGIPELYIGTCVTPDGAAKDYLDEKRSREIELNRLTILSYECGNVFLTEWEYHDWHETEYVLQDGQIVNYVPWWLTENSTDTTITSHFRYQESNHSFSAKKGDKEITYFIDEQEVEKEEFVKTYQSFICDMRVADENIYVYNEENLKKVLLIKE